MQLIDLETPYREKWGVRGRGWESLQTVLQVLPLGGREKEGRMSSIEIQFSESFGKGDGDFLSQCCCQKSLVS